MFGRNAKVDVELNRDVEGLLHEAGKADDFRLSADGSGLILSERGRWIGYRQTLLEWLAVARTEVIVGLNI